MAREWRGRCALCAGDITYADSLAVRRTSLGRPRMSICPNCERLERHELRAVPTQEVALDGEPIVAGSSLGRIPLQRRPHRASDRTSGLDTERSKFGVSDAEIAHLYHELQREDTPVVIAVAPTGSGKSTFLPYRLLVPDGLPSDTFTRGRQIVITQPRRDATIGITGYVAETLHGAHIGVGHEIGYRVRGSHACDWDNRLVYVTDGTLINWIVRGELDRFSMVVLDEAHERSRNIDVIIGLLSESLPLYPHLKLLIVSATIDQEKFRRHFDQCLPGHLRCGVVECSGSKPVGLSVHWRRPRLGRLDYAAGPLRDLSNEVAYHLADAVVRLLVDMESPGAPGRAPVDRGDVLGFLHGAQPIDTACRLIRERLDREYPDLSKNTDVYPLYAAVDERIRETAIGPKKDETRRKVVIASNAAETSLTIKSLVHVVDSGFIKQTRWDPDIEQSPLLPIAHSQAGCRQRWGRVGRTAEGFAWSLYTKEQFDGIFPRDTTPEIQRSCLDGVILSAKRGGADQLDATAFPWLDAPDAAELLRSSRRLRDQGFIDGDGDLTPLGVRNAFAEGEDALYSRAIEDADRFGLGVEIATLVPIIKAGLKIFFPDDPEWEPEQRRAIAGAQERFRSGCADDLELALRVYDGLATDRRPPGWARRFGIDGDAFPDIRSGRNDILRQLGSKKKELEDRPLDFSGLDRLRVVLFRALHDQAYVRDPSDPGPEARYVPLTPGSEGPAALGLDSSSCLRYRPPGALIAVGPKGKIDRRRGDDNSEPLLLATFAVTGDAAAIREVAGLSDTPLAHLLGERFPRPRRGSSADQARRKRELLRAHYPEGRLVKCRILQIADDRAEVEVLQRAGWSSPPLPAVVGRDRIEGSADARERSFDFRYSRRTGRVQSQQEEDFDPIDEVLGEGDTAGSPDEWHKGWPTAEAPQGRVMLFGASADLAPGAEITAEVVGHEDLDGGPSLLLAFPESGERFRLFADRYGIGREVDAIAIGRSERPDVTDGLRVREPATGFETVVDFEDLWLSPDPELARLYPPGTPLRLRVESIDEQAGRVTLSALPSIERALQRIASAPDDTHHPAIAERIGSDDERVYVTISLTPGVGEASIAVKVLAQRSQFEVGDELRIPFRPGDVVHASLRFPEQPQTRYRVPELSDRDSATITKAGIGLSDGYLRCRGRMTLATHDRLVGHLSPDAAQAVHDLYLQSNRVWGLYVISDLEKRYPTGSVVEGTVTWAGGSGVDMTLPGGAAGKVAPSEVTWWTNRPVIKQYATPGQRRRALVIGSDVRQQVVHLSFRQLTADPWLGGIHTRYPAGRHFNGIVRRTESYGAFVELEPGLDGMIHVSRLRAYHGTYVNHASEVVQEGDTVIVGVEAIELATRRISLTLIQRTGRVTEPTTPPPGDTAPAQDETPLTVEWLGPEWPWTAPENAIRESKKPLEPPAPPAPPTTPLTARPSPCKWWLTQI